MRNKLLILFLVVVVGLGSYGIYFYLQNRDKEPTRGTFIYKNINDIGDDDELNNLYKSSDQSYFI